MKSVGDERDGTPSAFAYKSKRDFKYIILNIYIMKQIVLNIEVSKDYEKLHEIKLAQMKNVESCIDLWHTPGTEIKLSFEEIDVTEVPHCNTAPDA